MVHPKNNMGIDPWVSHSGLGELMTVLIICKLFPQSNNITKRVL